MKALLSRIAAEFGTPCFVYNLDEIRQRTAAVRAAFGGRFRISYAVKSNPNTEVLRRMREMVDSLDISSGGELERALKAGWPAEMLSFTGPGKTDDELKLAANNRIGAVVVESVEEARRFSRVCFSTPPAADGHEVDRAQFRSEISSERCAEAHPTTLPIQRVAVRIAPAKLAPGFGVSMSGRPCQFGIDEEDLDPAIAEIRALRNLDLVGLHIYAGTQCLKPEAVSQSYLNFIEIFRTACERHEIRPRFLIFGSGLGIPYHEQDKALDLSPIAAAVCPALDALRAEKLFAQTDLMLEMGRYLLGPAGVYLTRIVSRKRSRGVEIRICDGGMNHHLAACGHLGSVIHRNYRMFKVTRSSDGPAETYDLFGPLCTSIDMLAHNVKLPALDIGDVIAIENSGAYGPTASPTGFISHAPAKEILVAGEEAVDTSE